MYAFLLNRINNNNAYNLQALNEYMISFDSYNDFD